MNQKLIDDANHAAYHLQELLKGDYLDYQWTGKPVPFFFREKWKCDLRLLQDRIANCLRLVDALE